MTMIISAVCSDIDGTLLNKDRELSNRTIAAIRAVKHRVPVILASSRMPSAMTHLQQQLGIEDHPLICYNGGYVLRNGKNVKANEAMDSVRISVDVCDIILRQARMCDVRVNLFWEDDWYTEGVDKWTDKEQRVTKVSPTISSFEPVIARWRSDQSGAHKIMCMGEETEIEKLSLLLDMYVSSEIHIYRSKSTYLELAPKAISKASALKMVMRDCFGQGIENVIAFGDNYNDIEMLREVGYGVAVNSAIDVVKSSAWSLTAGGKEDGVAIAIEKYFSL